MTDTQALELVKRRYDDTMSKIIYLGEYENEFCYGAISKEFVLTIDRPYYILVAKNDTIREVAHGMLVDSEEEYNKSEFASIERKYRFFENSGIFID